MKFVLRRIQGREKRNALNVIPVIVRHKNVRVDRRVARTFVASSLRAIAAGNFILRRIRMRLIRRAGASRQMTPQHPQPGAAIQNKSRAARSGQLQTRRVAAVAPGGLVHGGGRAANSPEPDLCRVCCQKILV